MTLTAPLFLIGLLAVGIPIAIHLLQLRRYKKVYFSNVSMLQELQSENRKQSQLRRLLILAARILTIVFLVLAFCQPVIRHRHQPLQSGATVVSVYVDNSFSMECGGMDGSLLESAKAKAAEVAAAYKPGDLFQLITNDLSGGQFHWLSREDFLQAVSQIDVSPTTTPLSAIALRQNQFLHAANAANRHAYIISDFQRATSDIENYPADSLIYTTFLPLGGSDVDNIYIDSLAFDAPAYYPGALVRVHATVTNRGGKAVERLPLRLFAADKQRAVTTVDLPAHGSATADMSFTLDDTGTCQGYVETTDYPITFDDRMFFTLAVQQQTPMLVVSGQAENPYLRRLFASDTLIGYHQCAVGQVDYSHLTDHRFIVLDELHAISSGMAQTLTEYVQQGGALLVIPARDAETQSYNQLLSAMHAPLLEGWDQQSVRASEADQSHPLYHGVFQGRGDNMELPTAMGRYRLRTSSATVCQPLIRLADGSALLISLPVGEQGHLYLSAMPLRSEHTDFVKQALFVPTLYNMALFSAPQQQPYHLLSATDPIPLADKVESDQVVHLLGADADIIPDIRRLGSRQCLLPHGQIATAGNYRLSPTQQGISFNYSRQESDLTSYAPAELERILRQQGLEHCSLMSATQKSVTDYIRQRQQGTPLWRWCLVLALLAILVEIILIRFKK